MPRLLRFLLVHLQVLDDGLGARELEIESVIALRPTEYIFMFMFMLNIPQGGSWRARERRR